MRKILDGARKTILKSPFNKVNVAELNTLSKEFGGDEEVRAGLVQGGFLKQEVDSPEQMAKKKKMNRYLLYNYIGEEICVPRCQGRGGGGDG